MATQVLPLYGQYFGSNSDQKVDWNLFKTKDLTAPLSRGQSDFSITDRGWKHTALKVAILAAKIIILPWGLYCLVKYTFQRLVMTVLYPAQSRIVKCLDSSFRTKNLDIEGEGATIDLYHKDFIVRYIALEKNGVRYSGLLIGHKDTIANGKWAIQSTGNIEPIEQSASNFAETYKKCGFNTLLVNGPGVGRSQGTATPNSMGNAQEIGISFLETAIKAQKIVIAGRSLGGAAIGQAIMKHQFKQDVKYLVIRQMTFDRVSNICAKTVSRKFPALKRIEGAIKKIVRWCGCEMDVVESSKKLEKLNINEIIVQAGALPDSNYGGSFYDDGIIPPEASLGYALVKEHVFTNKGLILGRLGHTDDETISIAVPVISAFSR